MAFPVRGLWIEQNVAQWIPYHIDPQSRVGYFGPEPSKGIIVCFCGLRSSEMEAVSVQVRKIGDD